MQIELLVIPNCPHEAAAGELVAAAVTDTAVQATITSTFITDEQTAARRGFIGSPTILINGVDPFASLESPVALACRHYSTPDGLQGVPGLRDLRQALTRAAAG